MAGRAIRITARILFFVSGLISFLNAAPYVLLRGADIPVESEWVVFVVALGLVGFISLAAALLPRRWIAKACRKDRDDPRLFSSPLKLLGGFAAVFYLVAVAAFLAPHAWNLNTQGMLEICPMYLLKMNIDPSLVVTFFILAPMNAAAYGSLGVTFGYAILSLRRRR